MKNVMIATEKKSAKAPAADQKPAAAKARLTGLEKAMLAAMQDYCSSSRQALLEAALKNLTQAKFTMFLHGLAKTPVMEGAPPTPRQTTVQNLTAARTLAFDPLAAGQRVVQELQAAEGGAWTGHQLQTLFKLIPATLHKRRREHRIIYWRDAQNNFHYPKWQFNDAGALLPGIQKVLEQFKSQDEWRVMSFFLGRRAQLSGQRPIDLLRQGDVARVLAHTKIHVEENTW